MHGLRFLLIPPQAVLKHTLHAFSSSSSSSAVVDTASQHVCSSMVSGDSHSASSLTSAVWFMYFGVMWCSMMCYDVCTLL